MMVYYKFDDITYASDHFICVYIYIACIETYQSDLYPSLRKNEYFIIICDDRESLTILNGRRLFVIDATNRPIMVIFIDVCIMHTSTYIYVPILLTRLIQMQQYNQSSVL